MTNEFAQMAADFNARIVELERIVNPACATVESHGWIVTYPGSTTAYAFDVVNKQATNIRVERCERANRFTKGDAKRVAADCLDKEGNPLEARHYRDVCADELHALRDLVARLEEMAAA
ncbi:MAG: hypothetical protein FKY71_08115 [Spiribacter salinus]|uniref:Uncharacterized protein n=1 Tax=Spiribacter salinus TaxID=1335746 RepID=A0A540VS15_9GAMM|nr:MAG: hypothetical protein FKY71_08115 [Spiribacter salinus]